MFNKKFWLFIIIAFALLNTSLVTFYQPLMRFGKKISFRQPTYWAVYLNNEQVYFGEIKKITPETIKLADVFYLEASEAQSNQTSQSFQIQPSSQKAYNLVKRGGANPLLTDNVLFINRSTVLFWEKLKPDSQAVKLIEKVRSQK